MTTAQRIVPLALLLLLVAGCELLGPGAGDEEEAAQSVRTLTVGEEALVQADNRFGLNLFRAVSADEPDANVFVSPLSVSMALGMTLNGAADSTYRAMAAVLEKEGLTTEAVNQSYRSLIDLLRSLDPAVALEIANSIWYREGFAVEQSFLDVNRTYFDAEVQALDFTKAEAVTTINRWVDEATHGKIEDIVEAIPPEAVMYLINAIYFKGDWTYRFDPQETEDAAFHNADGTTTEVPLMHQEAALPYVRTDRYTAVDLPYGDSLYSMTVVLPVDGLTVSDLVADLDPAAWQELTSSLAVGDVRVYLPRFELEYEKELGDVLAALGMGVAFGAQADFSGINPVERLSISRVLHKTFVEVNEEGTEAAAVTAVEIELTSVPSVPTVRADRPFLFFIREQHSGSILFVGQVLGL